MNTFSSLQEKINNARELDFGTIIDNVFGLYKKAWLQGFLLMLIIIVIMVPFIITLYFPMYTNVLEQVQSGEYDPNDADSLVRAMPETFRYTMLGFTFVISFITTGIVAGFYRILKAIDHGESFRFADFFSLFKFKYLGKIFAIASFSLMVALINWGAEIFLPQLLATTLNGILSVILSVYTTLFVVFFAFNSDLESSDFFMLSYYLGSKKWLLIFGLLIVTGIIGVLGVVACGFGLLFTMSIMYMPVYFVYKEVIGFNTLSKIDEIGLRDDTDLNF